MQRRDKNKVREIAKRYVRNGMNLSKAVKEVYDKPYNPNVLGVMTQLYLIGFKSQHLLEPCHCFHLFSRSEHQEAL